MRDPAPFADIGEIMRQALPAYLPPERVPVPDHAAMHRWLDNPGGGYVGRWSHDEAPYLVAPMEDLTSPDYITVVVPGPNRCGKTAIAENWLLQSVDADPVNMLWYEPTDDVVQSYVKTTINPMIAMHELLKTRLGVLPVDRSLHFKNFTSGMWVEFLAASDNNLRNKSASRIVVDEQDSAPESLGDLYELADQRRQTFGRESMVLSISHPDKARGLNPEGWNRGIMRLYAASTRCTWWWPCPECNDYSSPNPTAARVMTLNYPELAPLDEIADAARLECPSCGALIEDKHRRAMNIDGKWAGIGQTVLQDGTIEGERARRDVAGYWIVGLMSPFIIGGIGALARAKVQAERDMVVTADDTPLRQIMARRWGIPYDPRPQAGQVDADTLAGRAEDRPLRVVPQGVRFLTAFVDVQQARFEVLVRGWGVDGESWIVDMQRIPADTGVSPLAWDALLTALLAAAYPLADGTGRGMKLRAIGVDSAGAPGVTQQAYAAWRRLRQAGKTRFMGRADNRDLFNVVLTKGMSGPEANRLQVSYPTSKRTDRDARGTGCEPVVQFAPNKFKDDLAGQLACAEPGPLYIHFPAALRGDWPIVAPETEKTRHAWFEQLVSERPDARGRWSKVQSNAANEALDMHVGTHLLAELHGLTRIKWDRPPNWAAPWDRNITIVPAASVPALNAPPSTTATPGPAAQPATARQAQPGRATFGSMFRRVN